MTLEQENELLKKQIIQECKEHHEAMLIAGKRINELQEQNAWLKKIIQKLLKEKDKKKQNNKGLNL